MSSLGRTDKLGKAPPQPECAHCGIRFNGVQKCLQHGQTGNCQTQAEVERLATGTISARISGDG